MPTRIRLVHENETYSWSPSKSTPSTANPVAELPQIVAHLRQQGFTSIVDFGAGRGRNAQVLLRAFHRVLLVEDDANIPTLQSLARRGTRSSLSVQTWEQYRADTSHRYDAILICFVLHTIPSTQFRRQIIETNISHLRNSGALVFITPKHDPKYRPAMIADAVTFRDGIVRLYKTQRTFSFYRNYSLDEFTDFLSANGLTIETTIPSESRMIFITSPM
jgi:2-polyprenyl-3-methyl-5-hydroxy-6-metoxy-1,4-benzoquinol methylase